MNMIKKNRVFDMFHSWGHSYSVFKFPKILVFIMCGAFERKENDFWDLKNVIHTYDTAIKMVKFTTEV